MAATRIFSGFFVGGGRSPACVGSAVVLSLGCRLDNWLGNERCGKKSELATTSNKRFMDSSLMFCQRTIMYSKYNRIVPFIIDCIMAYD